MAKKRKKVISKAKEAAASSTADESRGSVAVTVAWMLSLLVTLAADAIAFLVVQILISLL